MKHKSTDDEEGELVMWNEEDGIEINIDIYNHFS